MTKPTPQAPNAGRSVAPCYYNDGCVRNRSYVYLSSKLKSVDPDEYVFSRMVFYKAPQWGKHDLGWNVESVCYSPANDTLHALSVWGDVDTRGQGFASAERIEDASTIRSTVNQIRWIGTHLYVCGQEGQVYRRDDAGWVHIDDGLLDSAISPHVPHLLSIDGTADDDLTVVGMHGRIFRSGGQGWTEFSSPTTEHLTRVRCVSRDEVYACGRNGVLVKITPDGIDLYTAAGVVDGEGFWGLEHYEGKVYLAALRGLHVFDGTRIEPVDTGLHPPIGGYRLEARDGVLWSFGAEDLAWYDGKAWTRLRDPDNA